MGIVLNEHHDAEEAIKNRSLGKKPSETLRRVARYYIDEHGISDKNIIRNRVESFLLQCDPTIPLPKWSDILDFVVKRAFKYPAIIINNITITKPEIAVIDSLKGRQLKRLAFSLLCLAKYWDIAGSGGDHWVNNKDNEIMTFANIKTSVKRQCEMFAELRELGLLQFSKKVDNTNVRVCFIEDGEPILHITDLRNLGYQYLKYCGEPYFECVNCGVVTRFDNPENKNSVWKQKYCKSCASEIATKQKVNSVMRLKTKNNTKFLNMENENPANSLQCNSLA